MLAGTMSMEQVSEILFKNNIELAIRLRETLPGVKIVPAFSKYSNYEGFPYQAREKYIISFTDDEVDLDSLIDFAYQEINSLSYSIAVVYAFKQVKVGDSYDWYLVFSGKK